MSNISFSLQKTKNDIFILVINHVLKSMKQRWCMIEAEFQVEKMESSGDDGSDGCTTV